MKILLSSLLLILLSISNYSIADSYILKKEKYRNNIVSYYELDTKKIVDTTFSLKENQNTEIMYIFSYNCQSCYAMSEHINLFSKYVKKTKNIRFEKIPFLLENSSEIDKINAKIYFSRKIFKFNDDFDDIIFNFIHEKNVSIKNEEDFNLLMSNYLKISKEELNKKEYKEKIEYRLKRTSLILKEIKITTTPTTIIHKNGKRYKITADVAGSLDNYLLTIFAILDKKNMI
jgi:hypothetical protein